MGRLEYILAKKDTHRNNLWGWFILYMIWPFGIFVKSFDWIRTREAMNIFWLFCIYFGFTFVIAEGSYADSDRIARYLQEMNQAGTSFSEFLNTLYSSETAKIDILESLLTFIVSRFTGDHRFLFAVFGFVFGYFYSRNIWLVMNRSNTSIGLFAGLILFSLAFTSSIWDINGFRFAAATQIFVYGALHYLLDGNKSKLLFAFVSIFVHWSFLIALTVLLIYLVLRNHPKIFFTLFILSFFMSFLQLDIIREWFDSYAPAVVQDSRASYLEESTVDAVERYRAEVNWYVTAQLEIIKWFVFVYFSYIFLFGYRKLTGNKPLSNLLNFSLLFYAVVNTISMVPSVGRFYLVANIMSLALIFLYFQLISGNIPIWIKKMSIPFLVVFLVIKLRFASDFIGALLFIGNPFFASLSDDHTPIIDFVKSIF